MDAETKRDARSQGQKQDMNPKRCSQRFSFSFLCLSFSLIWFLMQGSHHVSRTWNEVDRLKCIGSLLWTNVCIHMAPTPMKIWVLSSTQEVPSTAFERSEVSNDSPQGILLQHWGWVRKLQRGSIPGEPWDGWGLLWRSRARYLDGLDKLWLDCWPAET